MVSHDRNYRRTVVIQDGRVYSYTSQTVITVVTSYNWLRRPSSLRSSLRRLFGPETGIILTTVKSTLSGTTADRTFFGMYATEEPTTLPVCLFFDDVAE